jgi:hypothetical protein
MSVQTYSEVKQLIEQIDEDFAKFHDKSNKTAGTRCRLAVLAIQKLLPLLRKQILEERKATVRPPKKEKVKATRGRGRPVGSKSKKKSKELPKESDE